MQLALQLLSNAQLATRPFDASLLSVNFTLQQANHCDGFHSLQVLVAISLAPKFVRLLKICESLRQEVAAYAMKEACYHELLKRIDQARRAGRTPGPEASVIKLVGTELKKARYDLEMRIAGTHGLGWSGAGFCEGDLETTRAWLRSRANSIEGGTSEIQLNILAQRVLGLPKGSA